MSVAVRARIAAWGRSKAAKPRISPISPLSAHKVTRSESKPDFPIRISPGHGQGAIKLGQVLKNFETHLKAEQASEAVS